MLHEYGKDQSKKGWALTAFLSAAFLFSYPAASQALTEAAADKAAKPVPAAPARLALKPLWSYVPVQAQPVPQVTKQDWVKDPIDAFVLQKLEEKGLQPSPETDRATYIRRATLDAWGIIPTPEQVDAFVNDESPDAYDKLVDRLLSSPHYGERQARRWLDLARYADSTGFQNDVTRPNMWRYRDYVINAFNQDKPYDQFIREQVAGDEIAPGDLNVTVATGFLAGYPDNYNSRDLVQRKYQITTDMTDTVGEVFLAQSVACARCHDHKFDKISAKEYFQLQAFFANTAEVMDVPAPVIGEQELKYREAQAKWENATKDIRAKRTAILNTVKVEGEKHHKERYLTDSRVSIFKPESEWTAHDRWINHRLQNVETEEDILAYLEESALETQSPIYKPANLAKYYEAKQLTDQLKTFEGLKPTVGSDKYTIMTELGHQDAPPTYLFFGGDHERPLEEVQPAFPEAIAQGEKPVITPTAVSSGRRTALANWIASPKNPLTARVYVNRVWNEYFGKGIVGTVSDFGRVGDKPTHPELLDFLADRFVKEGWSVKTLHRHILLSNVYRQAAESRNELAEADPDNRLLATFPRKRLDAEQIRDSLLVASGELNETIGGPSVFAPVPSNLNAGAMWPVSANKEDHNRRSLYIFTRRSVAYPLLETFDMASPQQVHSKRSITTTPLQALALANSELVYGWSQQLAGRVLNETPVEEPKSGFSKWISSVVGGNKDPNEQRVDRLYQILFARSPDAQERELLTGFLNEHEATIKAKAAEGKFNIAVPTGVDNPNVVQDPIKAAAFVDLVHTVANSNEFVYRN